MSVIDAATLEFANRLADAAGAVIRPYFRRPLAVIDKGQAAFDPVTEADRGAETALRTIIARERPDDAILGEEYGFAPGRSGRMWVLDPVDGTRAFITGRHTWGTLIALEEEGTRALGIIDQPVLRERFVGCNGTAMFHSPDGARVLRTRACATLADAVVSTTHPWGYFDAPQRGRFEQLAQAARMSYFGVDCYAYALLAMGHIDVIAEASLKAWDVAALIPVVEHAGGVASDWNGDPVGAQGGTFLAAGDARVHEQAVRILSG
jgi:myo-inositol-1(or 4)-monophosphatase